MNPRTAGGSEKLFSGNFKKALLLLKIDSHQIQLDLGGIGGFKNLPAVITEPFNSILISLMVSQILSRNRITDHRGSIDSIDQTAESVLLSGKNNSPHAQSWCWYKKKVEPAPQFIGVHNPGTTLVTASAVSDDQPGDQLRNIFFLIFKSLDLIDFSAFNRNQAISRVNYVRPDSKLWFLY